jgi:hypothetical protein
MTTRIRVQPPSASGETARALQAVNRRRLEQREEDDRTLRDAARRIRQQTTRTRADRDRAVPEFEPIEPVFTKRYGKAFRVASAWWSYEQVWNEEGNTSHAIIVSSGNREHTARIDLPQIQLIDNTGGGLANNDQQGLVWWHCLPAGKDRLVLVFYVQIITATATQIGELTPEPTEEDFPPNPGPADTFEYAITDTRSTQYSSPEVRAITKAAIVSPLGINVIDCPEPMVTAAARIHTYITGASVNNYYVNTGTIYTMYYRTELEPDGSYQWYLFTTGIEPTARQRSDIITTYANDNKWDRDRFVWLYLLRAYGYGRLVDRDRRTVGHEQDPGWGWTPAIYSYLKNYEGQFHVSSTDPSLEEFRANAANYKYVRERFFPDDAPPFLLTSGVQTKEATAAGIDTTADYWYLRAPDAETASAISTADFNTSTLAENGNLLRRNNGVDKQEPVFSSLLPTGFYDGLDLSADNQDGALATWTFGEEIPVIAWDWGASACLLAPADAARIHGIRSDAHRRRGQGPGRR